MLRPLDRGASDEILARATASVGPAFTADDKRRLHELSGGVPAALQAAAFSLYHGRLHGLSGSKLWNAVEGAALEIGAPTEVPAPLRDGDGATATEPGLKIDRTSGEVIIDGHRVESLTALEYNLLECLSAQPGRLRTKEEIVREVWGEELSDDTRVEKLVSRLRRKIEPVPGRPRYIRTVRGRGYRLVV